VVSATVVVHRSRAYRVGVATEHDRGLRLFVADVAGGVTFIPATPEQDMRALADAALDRIARRLPLAGAA